MSSIKIIRAREILDSRGNPTVEADVVLESGIMASAAVPSGASTGSREAVELRDGDKKRYQGKGVLQAIRHIHELIGPKLMGLPVTEQMQIDNLLIQLDGTENKSHLGANAMLAVSLAVARAAATEKQIPLYLYLAPNLKKYALPVPMMNIINGGAHADNQLDIQEFMVVPMGAPNFSEALRYGVEIFHALKAVLKKANLATNVGDEGGFAPALKSHQEALDLIMTAIAQTGLNAGKEVGLALDAASSEFYRDQQYHLAGEGKKLNNAELCQYWRSLVDQYPIISIEDGMAEDDWDGWILLTRELGKHIQLVGDDLFVTNTLYLEEGIRRNAANAILIKLNQIGTLTETLATMHLAQSAGFNTIVSHRSGETEDTFIADLAVATNALQIKTGSLCRTDRVAKYNRLLRIEQGLAAIGYYPGASALKVHRS